MANDNRNITFTVSNVDEVPDGPVVELMGSATSITPDFVIKARARIKALRVVGVEAASRELIEDISEGTLSRVTEILDFEVVDQGPIVKEVRVDVGVTTQV